MQNTTSTRTQAHVGVRPRTHASHTFFALFQLQSRVMQVQHPRQQQLQQHHSSHSHSHTQPQQQLQQHHTTRLFHTRSRHGEEHQYPLKRGLNGVIPVIKPVDALSYSVVHRFKKLLDTEYYHKRNATKVGHGGVLDSFASGVLGV